MKTRYALPAAAFTAGLLAAVPTATAEPPVTPPVDTTAEAAADKSPGFLGVAVAESLAPPTAGSDIPRTVLLISKVMPESPADTVGLRSGDTLLELNGQVLLHPVQFQRLVAHQPAGREIELTIIRDGQRETITVTLGERPAKLANPDQPQVEELPLRPGQFEGFENLPRNAPLDLEQMQQRMDQQFEQMRRMFREGMDQGWPGNDVWGPNALFDFELDLDALPGGRQVSVLQDQQHRLTITQTEEGRHLTAADRDGNVVFEGPIDTAEQLEAVPEEIRVKIPEAGQAFPENFRLDRPVNPRDLLERLRQRVPQDNDEPGEQFREPAGRAV
ncbi:MAG: PDZ domain-containing protein [Planctomycetota bacterium]